MDYTYIGILEHPDERKAWHPVAYLSKKITPTEKNYDICNKELLAIIKATKVW